MNRSYITFFRKLALLGLIVALLDIVLGMFLERSYLNIKSGGDIKTIYAIEHAREDLVVLGSSRAYHHYVTPLLEQHFHLSAYNAGRDGAGILYHYAVFKSISRRKMPKMIIMDLNTEEFSVNKVPYDRLSYLLPHYNRHEEIRSVVNLRSATERIKVLSNLYRYNSLLFYIALNNLEKTRIDIKGYMPLEGSWKGKLETDSTRPSAVVDSVFVQYFERLIGEAKAGKCRLIVCISPIYSKQLYRSSSISIMENLCRKHDILFFNYSQLPEFLNNPDYFYGVGHLNNKGAERYTRILAEDIKAAIGE